jgi:hypothetical protein
MANEELASCEACGATIYPEHLKRHAAERIGGKLLCKHCLSEATSESEGPNLDLLADRPPVPSEPDNPPITLAFDDGKPDRPAAGEGRSQRSIQAFGGGITMSKPGEEIDFKRPTLLNVPYATRCRTFHAKLNEASISYLDRMINEWVDANEDIQIKFATSSIGVFEGKHADPNLIVTVFY